MERLQIAANTILLIGANLLGLTSSYLEDVQQKKAFLDTKQCLEMKLVIEEQSAEQGIFKKFLEADITLQVAGSANFKNTKYNVWI
uniref:Uncharacterized protein n=1 Tax=Rhodnius prolixus TaxID=13249 RepID=T1I019_RHOPR